MIRFLAWCLVLSPPITLLATLYLHVVALRARPRTGLIDDWARISVVLSALSVVGFLLALGYLIDVPALGLPGGVLLGFTMVGVTVVPDYLALRVALLRWGRGLSLVPPAPEEDASDQLDPQ